MPTTAFHSTPSHVWGPSKLPEAQRPPPSWVAASRSRSVERRRLVYLLYGYRPTRQSPQHLAHLERAAALAAARAAAAAAARSAPAPPKSMLLQLKDMVADLLKKFSKSALLKAVKDFVRRFTRDAPPSAAAAAAAATAAAPRVTKDDSSSSSGSSSSSSSSSSSGSSGAKKPAPLKAMGKKVKALWADAKAKLTPKRSAARRATVELDRDGNCADGSSAAAAPPVEASSAADAVAVVSVAPAKATGKGKAALKSAKASLKAAFSKLGRGLCFAP